MFHGRWHHYGQFPFAHHTSILNMNQQAVPSKRILVNTDFEVRSLDQKQAQEKQPQLSSYLGYLVMGIFFGIILIKSEVVSWFRIQEMFRFQSFQLYGLMASAIVVGIISVALIIKFNARSISGESIVLPRKKFNKGQVFGGLLFGLGWGITGACPGPLFAQIGAGATVVIITLLSAIAGTWVYGRLREYLPH
jgi:uncharacterized membrane protein YedE/YeeE